MSTFVAVPKLTGQQHPMAITSQLKEDQIRASVLQAAQQLFQQYGLLKVTMEDVARAIGKGKSTLYYYYSSKEEIFDAVLDNEISEALRQMQQALEEASTAPAQLENFYLVKFKLFKQKVALYGVVNRDMRQQPDFLRRIRARYVHRETALLKQVLTRGVRDGDFSALADQDLDMVALVLFSSFAGLEQELAYNEAAAVPESAVRLMLQMLVRGMKV